MNNKRLRLVLLGLLGVGALLFIIIATSGLSMLSKKSQKMVDLKLQSKVLDYKLTSLLQAKRQVQQYSYIKNVAKEIIPNDKDQAQAVLEISKFMKESQLSLASITFPVSTLGAASHVTGDATHASSSTIISQATPVVGIKGLEGLYSVQLTVTPETGLQVPVFLRVSYKKILKFLSLVEHNQRTAQITQVNIQPQSSGTSTVSLTFSLTINIFIKP